MGVREEGAMGRDREGLQEAVFAADCHFFLVCHISRSPLFPTFERTQGRSPAALCPSRCKVATDFNSDKLMLKVDSEVWHRFANAGKGREAAQEQPG